ncbi:hypothetical protein HYU19_01195 [Candidatus Woesearchaeota archaeon]|nr:hypothetical protein [Candidatus Woesearchaeota archaeon]
MTRQPEDQQSHLEQVERWAKFVREHPTEWKKIHTEFINAIFQKQEEALQRILAMPGGKEKAAELYTIKNKKGIRGLGDNNPLRNQLVLSILLRSGKLTKSFKYGFDRFNNTHGG